MYVSTLRNGLLLKVDVALQLDRKNDVIRQLSRQLDIILSWERPANQSKGGSKRSAASAVTPRLWRAKS